MKSVVARLICTRSRRAGPARRRPSIEVNESLSTGSSKQRRHGPSAIVAWAVHETPNEDHQKYPHRNTAVSTSTVALAASQPPARAPLARMAPADPNEDHRQAAAVRARDVCAEE